MQVEQSLCGEYMNVQMTMGEGDLLHSFISFFLREKVDSVTNEEYDVAQKLCDEISLYIEDDRLGSFDKEAVTNFFKSL